VNRAALVCSLIFPVIATGCATQAPLGIREARRAPFFENQGFSNFFGQYDKGYHEIAGPLTVTRQFVQLGLPDTNTVVVWYALSETAGIENELSVLVDGKPVAKGRLRHNFNVLHRTGRIDIEGLAAGTQYTIGVHGHGLESRTIRTRTADREGAPFSFVFASCFAPYSTSKPIADLGDSQLASMINFRNRARAGLEGGNGPAFFIGLGDQVYTDPGATEGSAPLAYLHGKHSERIRSSRDSVPHFLRFINRYSFGLPAMDSAFEALPSVMMWDDHDIRDGWGSQRDESHADWNAYYQDARDVFVAFQGARNPNFRQIVNARHWTEALPAQTYRARSSLKEREWEDMSFSFKRGLATFFVADARSVKWIGPYLHVGSRQLEEIRSWLGDPSLAGKPTVFVFAYPVPVFTNVSKPTSWLSRLSFGWFRAHADDASDRIHPSDQRQLLEIFAKHFANEPRHVLAVLSGDVHYSGLQSLHLKGPNGNVFGYEVISSGLSQTEYNKPGIIAASTISGYSRAYSNRDSLWVQDLGYYAGPSFAELFIDQPAGADKPPTLRLEFYPAKLRDSAVVLRTSIAPHDAQPISSYPANLVKTRGFFGRKFSDSQLQQTLDSIWYKSGRAQVFSRKR
jgi:hypothetical protein